MAKTTADPGHVTVRRKGRRTDLRMVSDPAVLKPVRVALEEFGRQAGLTCEQADQIGLVLNEALANVMRHAYGNATDKPIEVTFDHRGSGASAEIRVEIRDWAKPLDPSKLPIREPETDIDRIKPGGLGLVCMRRLMDQVTFTPMADGNLLTMIKKIGNVEGSSHV
jgi:anti-sigma regulatory factor (Ser/Thr protein kinase)